MMNRQHIFLLAETEDEEPVGFASYSNIQPAVYRLHKLYVLPSIQGRNIGRTLLEVVEEECREAGANKMMINVNRYNKAKNFYERLGYKVIGEENIDLGNGVLQEDFVLEKDIS